MPAKPRSRPALPQGAKRSAVQAEGACACGAVRFEIDVPAVWAWHDHGPASRHAQGCAYATYVGSWKSRFRMLAGEDHVTRYEDKEAGTARSFCARCGTPLFYERARSPKIVNIPRALFATRTGREPRYHLNITQQADWAYLGEALMPLKGYPGVMIERPRKKARAAAFDL
ncbi:GFA family protein [uncultured Phenylobacterium sp.]|uniref:GFA family protein n=1 Tax=uncultured Phenylobacterium sp. TaxID=349273 RepID=UPI0025E28F42|nr:GFA family protein [uncultured Phenylobacterium sp.]